MIPSPWVGVVLALAAFRITRLVGWDDLPPVAKLRYRLLGARWEQRSTLNAAINTGLTIERPEVLVTYRRPTLAHMIHCPYCIGFWVSLVTYVAWVFAPTQTLYGAAAFALSGAVGIIARTLDP